MQSLSRTGSGGGGTRRPLEAPTRGADEHTTARVRGTALRVRNTSSTKRMRGNIGEWCVQLPRVWGPLGGLPCARVGTGPGRVGARLSPARCCQDRTSKQARLPKERPGARALKQTVRCGTANGEAGVCPLLGGPEGSGEGKRSMAIGGRGGSRRHLFAPISAAGSPGAKSPSNPHPLACACRLRCTAFAPRVPSLLPRGRPRANAFFLPRKSMSMTSCPQSLCRSPNQWLVL
jgi:hypothetical protein